jgi:Tfp pilus assembly pilus retraction ATPase PilT
MVTMNASLAQLVSMRKITKDTAMDYSARPEELEHMLAGHIPAASSGRQIDW